MFSVYRFAKKIFIVNYVVQFSPIFNSNAMSKMYKVFTQVVRGANNFEIVLNNYCNIKPFTYLKISNQFYAVADPEFSNRGGRLRRRRDIRSRRQGSRVASFYKL